MRLGITTYLFLFIVLMPLTAASQQYDNNWIFARGYRWWQPDSSMLITRLIFKSEPLVVDGDDRAKINTNDCNVSMSDAHGNLLFYTNCNMILNAEHEVLMGSDSFNKYRNHPRDVRDGININQGMMVLADPGDSLRYYLLYSKMDFELGLPDITCVGFQYSVIDMRADGRRGGMVVKQKSLIGDSILIHAGGLTATRHANGRDWWIIQPELRSNVYQRILLTPDGLRALEPQRIGSAPKVGLSGACFSPDGSLYVRNAMLGGLQGRDYLDIYRFDRCTGLLSDHLQFAYGYDEGSGGVAISPNNRYLYIPHSRFTYQYDLWEEDIQAR